MSHGTKRSPAHLKTYRKPAKKGAPIAKPMAQPLIRSVKKSKGVVLLNPCFSSNTNVWYHETGSDGSDEMRNNTTTNATDCVIWRKC